MSAARQLSDADLLGELERRMRERPTDAAPRRARKRTRPAVTLTAADMERAAVNAARRGVPSRR